MTQEQLDSILALPKIEDQIKALSVSSFNIPNWEDLRKQYDPDEHAIKKDFTRYPVIENDSGGDDMKRITRALQKLAVNRMSQAMFATPTERSYSYDRDSEKQKQAVDVIEELYRVQNFIDAENIERAKQVNASCQVATVWRVYEEENVIGDQVSKFKLAHTSYSEIDGYKIYANIDNNKNLIVISFEYKDSSDVEFFDIYVGGTKPQFISYSKGEEWGLTEFSGVSNPRDLEVFPVVYTHLKEPVWGGDSGTTQVENIEELLSYQALYVKKNAAPVFTLDDGDTTGKSASETTESDSDKRKVIKVGKGGKVGVVNWDGNKDAVSDQEKRLSNAFFEDNQIPDTSFANVVKSNMSAENRDIVLADSKAKAIDLGGEWQKLFNDELNKIVIPNAKIMFPGLAKELNSISVTSRVKPYVVKSDKENAEFVATAGDSMSEETKVRKLGQVTDVDAEVKAIEEERSASANQDL